MVTAEENGTVTAVATAQDGSGVTGSLLITISNNPVGISNSLATEKVQIFPNPVTDKLNVKTAAPNAKLVIYNCLGSVIYELSVAGKETTIDVSSYAHGVYYIKVNNAAVQKFVK